MKKKNGFISISIIYSFFIVFLLIMLAMLASYMNKRYLKKKIDNGLPTEAACRSGELLRVCLENNAKLKQGQITSLSQEEISNGVNSDEEVGLFMAPDDYTRMNLNKPSLYYRGDVDDNYVKFGDYIWRIVRINGDNTYRLIYQGLYNSEAEPNESKVLESELTDAIILENYNEVPNNTITKVKYNFSSSNTNECQMRLNLYEFYANQENLSTGDDCNWWDVGCKAKDSLDSFNQYMKEKFGEKYAENCGDPEKIYGAHLLHNIGYMNNKTALLYRYDSKYDNQDDSEVKSYIDYWFKTSGLNKSNLNSLLSESTIFCGDKNRTKCGGKDNKCSEYDFDEDDNISLEKLKTIMANSYETKERYYYSGWERIVKKNIASLVCGDTGEISKNNKNKVVNLSRYNVSNQEKNLLYSSDNLSLKKGTSPKEKSESQNISAKTNYLNCGTELSYFNEFKYPYSLKCNSGRNYSTVSFPNGANYNATLEYLGNGDLTYPIAMLSADEAVFAGLIYGSDSKSYLLDYAQEEEFFWTMTLSYTDYTSASGRTGAHYFAVKQTGDSKGRIVQLNDYPKDDILDKFNDNEYKAYGAYMRPVINLVYSTVRCSGSGTASDPYIVGKNQYDASGNFIGNTCNE